MRKLYIFLIITAPIFLLFMSCKSKIVGTQQIVIGTPTINLREHPDINSKSVFVIFRD